MFTYKQRKEWGLRQTQRKNSFYRSNLIKKATRQEIIVKNYLDSKGVKYIFQKGFLKPFHRIVDFYIPSMRLIIEIDGLYHQYTKDKDELKDKLWSRFKTLRITNEQVDSGDYLFMV